MANYYKFSRKHFEYELKGILIRNNFGFMQDVTEEFILKDCTTWERIYKVPTKNKSVDIIIYSSVDMRTHQVRDIGSDAVRIVLRWTTKNGEVFKRVGKHYRLETLFKNLENTIKNTRDQVFQLNYKEFSKEVV